MAQTLLFSLLVLSLGIFLMAPFCECHQPKEEDLASLSETQQESESHALRVGVKVPSAAIQESEEEEDACDSHVVIRTPTTSVNASNEWLQFFLALDDSLSSDANFCAPIASTAIHASLLISKKILEALTNRTTANLLDLVAKTAYRIGCMRGGSSQRLQVKDIQSIAREETKHEELIMLVSDMESYSSDLKMTGLSLNRLLEYARQYKDLSNNATVLGNTGFNLSTNRPYLQWD